MERFVSVNPYSTFEVRRAADLRPAERTELIRLCTEAYEEDFEPYLDLLPHATHVLARLEGQLVSHAAWVTRWLQPEGYSLLCTAYVEAVATLPAYQGWGLASAVLTTLAEQITDYELAALSPSDFLFYERLGWEPWRGPLAIRTAHGLVPTDDEEVMILRLPGTPALDLTSRLTTEWRAGELW